MLQYMWFPVLKRWYALTAFADEDERRTARILLLLIPVMSVVYLVVCFVTSSFRNVPTVSVTAGAFVLLVGSLWLLTKAHLHASAFLFLAAMLISVTNLATFGQGIEDVGVLIFPVALVFAGLTLNRQLFLWYVGLVFAATLWLGVGQVTGAYRPGPWTSSMWLFVLAVLGSLVVAALAVYLLSSNLHRSLANARRELAQRKQAEEALRASEEQLRQSQKMEAIGQLAGGIAHDFNNLLHAILGYGELLLSDPESVNPGAREDLEQIVLAARRGSSLTKQILAFSRRQALRPTVVLLSDILDHMEPLLRRSLGEDVELITKKEPALWMVEADVHHFEQVIMNLAVNARDAMPHGGRLTMETANVELDREISERMYTWSPPGSYVVLRISDNGVGMEEAIRARAFEPFFTTKEPGSGTGLGLAVVYGTVKQSGGSIYVGSEPGKGTTFTIFLPRVAVPAPLTVPRFREVRRTHGAESILLVEDETGVRKLVARVLADLGYRVVAVGSVEEAQQAAGQAESPLDLLITDVVLPGEVQGNVLARDLVASRPDLAVIYISGYSRDALVHAGRVDRGVNLLEKPFTTQALAATVRAVLDQPCSPA